MKVLVDGEQIFSLNDTQMKVIKNDIHEDIFKDDMKRRLKYILMHKYERCYQRLRDEWLPKLAENGVTSVPLDPDKFAKLVFAQPNYECKKTRHNKAGEPPILATHIPFVAS